MRLAFRRSALFAAVSLIAIGAATAPLAQEAPSIEVQPDGSLVDPIIKIAPNPLIIKDESAPKPETSPEEQEEGEDAAEGETEDAAKTTVPIPAEWSPVPTDAAGRSAFGLYLAGRYGLRHGGSSEAAAYLTQAQTLTPEQPLLREQVFSSSLLGGRIETASRSVPEEELVSPFLAQSARLLVPVQAFREGDARRANALLKANPVDAPHERAGLYLQAWIAAAAGDWDQALATPPPELDIVSSLLVRANRAVLLEKRRHFDQAEAEWKDLTSHAVASRLFRLPFGQFLERRGRRDEALEQYQAAITAGAADRKTYLAIERVKAKGRPPALVDYKTGAALSLVTAADQASAQDAFQYGLVYLRLAQAIAPSGELSLQIAQTLRAAKLDAQARDELASIDMTNPVLYGAARYQLALSYQEAEDFDTALVELAKAEAIAPDDQGIAYAKANLLLQMKRYEEGLAVLNGPLLNVEAQGFEIYFLRGAAYSWLNQHAEAEANLWQALQLRPDNPAVLNHLGYQWVDQGKRVAEGAEMIAKAYAADSDNGNYQDSLGWAQFRQGMFDVAVTNLEQAVSKEPANPEINDHLGDAYWMIGRHREASFQWKRVLTLDPEPERREAIETKLKLEAGQPLPSIDRPASIAQ